MSSSIFQMIAATAVSEAFFRIIETPRQKKRIRPKTQKPSSTKQKHRNKKKRCSRHWFFPALWIPKVTVPSPTALMCSLLGCKEPQCPSSPTPNSNKSSGLCVKGPATGLSTLQVTCKNTGSPSVSLKWSQNHIKIIKHIPIDNSKSMHIVLVVWHHRDVCPSVKRRHGPWIVNGRVVL